MTTLSPYPVTAAEADTLALLAALAFTTAADFIPVVRAAHTCADAYDDLVLAVLDTQRDYTLVGRYAYLARLLDYATHGERMRNLVTQFAFDVSRVVYDAHHATILRLTQQEEF